MNSLISIAAAVALALATMVAEKDARAEEKHGEDIKISYSSYNPYTTTPVVD